VSCLLAATGCYAPLLSPGIPAGYLPDSFRYPHRSLAPPLNLANLTVPPPEDYLLGTNDVLEVTVPDLFPGAEARPLQVQVMASGEIQLPLARRIRVGGMNLLQAQEEITAAYADGILVKPRVSVSLAVKSAVEVVVLGEVGMPGAVELPRDQNDVGHALAAARGLSSDAADFIEVHRRVSTDEQPITASPPEQYGIKPWHEQEFERLDDDPEDPKKIVRIPLRGLPPGLISKEDVTLDPGDVVFVPDRKFEVFWVVGKLDESNQVRFSTFDQERELGAGLVLPRDRDIDVVTAVAMAGYIDPIDSPTTVTVHRRLPTGDPLLIHVNLIKARYDPRETVLVRAGDIIYVNPDYQWWFRRQWDRVVPSVFLIPYELMMSKAFFGGR